MQKFTAVYVVKLIFWRKMKFYCMSFMNFYTLCNLILNTYVTEIKRGNFLQRKNNLVLTLILHPVN